MREIDITDIAFYETLNKIYKEFNPDSREDKVISFANYVRQKYGVYINVRPNTERGPGHYELTRVFVENDARYNWLILEWS
jgi:hypothetical protein